MEWTGLDKLLLYEAAQQAGTKEARSVEREATPDSCRAASHRAVPGNDESGRPTSDLRPPTPDQRPPPLRISWHALCCTRTGMGDVGLCYCILYTVHCTLYHCTVPAVLYVLPFSSGTIYSNITKHRPAPASTRKHHQHHQQASSSPLRRPS